MTVPPWSPSRYSATGASAWTLVTNVVAAPLGVAAALVADGPVPHPLRAATENVAGLPPPSEPSVALVADPLVATDSPAVGPVAARTT
jgi:hypothetical protein